MISRLAQSIVQAPEMIAMSQDPLGVAGDLVFKQGSNEVRAAGPLSTDKAASSVVDLKGGP